MSPLRSDRSGSRCLTFDQSFLRRYLVRACKEGQAIPRICACSPEPSMLAYPIITLISLDMLDGSCMYPFYSYNIIGPRREKTCIWGLRTQKGAAHPRRLISAFNIRLSKLATFSSLSLYSVAVETGLSLALSETPIL